MLENFQRVNLEWIKSNVNYSTNSFTDPNGIYIVETDREEDFANKGIPRRISAYNPTDLNKYKINSDSNKIVKDENGEQGLLGILISIKNK